MIESLVSMLDGGKYTLVVGKNDDIRTSHLRGVRPLYEIWRDDPDFMSGAYMADKVIGKAAAALVIAGHIKRLHTHVISTHALELLDSKGCVDVTYDKLVDHIINRDQSGWCPLEKLCNPCADVSECIDRITHFLEVADIHSA